MQIRSDIIVRFGEGMADPGLRSQMDHMGDTVAQERKLKQVSISNIRMEHLDFFGLQPDLPVALELEIIIGVEIIKADDEIASRLEMEGEMIADKSGGAGD